MGSSPTLLAKDRASELKSMIKQRLVFVRAPEFARFMHKSRKTIHQWARTGFLIELGYKLIYDSTRHLSIGISPTHEDYDKFLSQSIICPRCGVRHVENVQNI